MTKAPQQPLLTDEAILRDSRYYASPAPASAFRQGARWARDFYEEKVRNLQSTLDRLAERDALIQRLLTRPDLPKSCKAELYRIGYNDALTDACAIFVNAGYTRRTG